MRCRALPIVAAATLALSLVAADSMPCHVLDPGDPATSSDDVTACEHEVWFHAPDGDDARKVGNLAALASAAGQGTAYGYPSWDAQPPQRSLPDGAGAVTIMAPDAETAATVAGDTARRAGGATFTGTFTGNLDIVAVELHVVLHGQGVGPAGSMAASVDRAPGGVMLHDRATYHVRVDLEIDGTVHALAGDALLLPPRPTGVGPPTHRVRFAATGLWDGVDAPEQVHDVRLTIVPVEQAEEEAAVVFDTAEAPSGIHFNRLDLDSYTVLKP